MIPPFRRVAAAVAVAVFALFAVACGDDDSGAASDAPAPTEAPSAPSATTSAPAVTEAPAVTDAPAVTEAPEPPADPDRVVQAGDSVSVHYVGTLDDGEQFDSSRDRGEPLSFVSSSGQMIPGFDAAVLGMKVGEIKTVRIEAADAYGEWTEDRVQTVDISQVPEDVAVGDELFSSTGTRFLVTEITDSEVTLDGNHRLAGQALTFEIELISIE